MKVVYPDHLDRLIWQPFFLQSSTLPVIYSALTRLNRYMVSKDLIAPSIERCSTEVQSGKAEPNPNLWAILGYVLTTILGGLTIY